MEGEREQAWQDTQSESLIKKKEEEKLKQLI